VPYIIEPEVAGGLGPRTVIDRSSGKMIVTKHHYQLDGWLGDDLIESSPCYIVSKRLADAVSREQLTGFTLDEVEIFKSEQFDELYPDTELPPFVWLKVHGEPGTDDFGMTAELLLAISDRALRLLENFNISNAASINPFP